MLNASSYINIRCIAKGVWNERNSAVNLKLARQLLNSLSCFPSCFYIPIFASLSSDSQSFQQDPENLYN